MTEGDDSRWPVDPLTIRRRSTPERVGLIDADTGEEWSYAALDDAAKWVACCLREAVDASDPTIGLVMDTRPAVQPLAFGGLRSGARVGLLDVNLDDDSLAARLDRLGADLLLCESATERQVTAVADCAVASVDEPTSSDVDRIRPFASEETERRANHSSDAHGELVAFTSGTTGEPKGVRLPLETLVASAVASALRLGVAADDRWLVPIPTYHVGGFSPFVRCTQAGTTAVLQRDFEADSTVDTLRNLDVTCVSLVPTQLARMLDAGWRPRETLRFALVGGGPVSQSLLERCRERGVPVCPTYGTTETASQVATALPETAFAHPGAVGRPLAFADVSIDDPGGEEGGDDTGEVVVDGPMVTPGYLGGSQQDAFDDEGFHTGDLGRVDGEGRLWIEGRLDDRIATGGENVRASTVADDIRELDAVTDVAVVGLPDPEWGERVAALVVAADDVDAEDVRAHSRAVLASYAVPKTVAVTDDLPRTPSGTVDRAAVERILR